MDSACPTKSNWEFPGIGTIMKPDFVFVDTSVSNNLRVLDLSIEISFIGQKW